MKEFEKIKINENSINEYSKLFIEQSAVNEFSNKNTYFTNNLKKQQIEFQIIGNLGGIPTQREFKGETDFLIISNHDFDLIKNGFVSDFLLQVEKSYNAKGKKHTKLKILTEDVFLQYVKERCEKFNDVATTNLLNRIS